MKNSIRIPLILFCLLVITYVSYDMFTRSSVEKLWGYRPLFLFLFAWFGLILGFINKFSKLPQNLTLIGWSTLSGVLLGIGFPDILPIPFLLFVGFIPLIYVEKVVSEASEGSSRWTIFKYSYHSFVTWNIISTYWVGNAAISAGLFAILVNSLLMSGTFVLFHQTKKAMPRLGYLPFIVYWLSFEYMHLNWELTWPWLNLGNGFAEYTSWVQWYEYFGALGGSFWILGINILLFKIIEKRFLLQKAIPITQWVSLACILVLPILWSQWRYYSFEEEGRPVEVVVVQPNYEPHYTKFSITESEMIPHYLALTAESTDSNTRYIIYPESSFGYVRTDQLERYPAIRKIRNFLSDYPNTEVITGMNAFHIVGPDEKHSKSVRRQVQKDKVIFFEVLNIAAQVSKDGESIPIYRKSKLVPGPENFPYTWLLFPFKFIVDKLGGTTEGIGIQKERSVFESAAGKMGAAICYESVFGEFFTAYIKQGAEAMCIITNDGWWDNTAGHRQHLLYGALRAIETRKSIARSANSGISAFISQRGDISQPTQYDQAASIKGTMLFNDSKTFYTIWGDMIARIAFFITIILLLNTLVRTLQGKKEGN